MIAYQCDRCNKVFGKIDDGHMEKMLTSESWVVQYGKRRIDLCGSCQVALERFIFKKEV